MTYTAVTALPYDDRDWATAALRAQIRDQLIVNGIVEPPDWRHLTVTGPTMGADYQVRPWYWYRATLEDPATPDDTQSSAPA